MARKTKRDTFKQIRRTLASGEVAVRGKVAFGKVGDGLLYADPSTSTVMLPLGYFTEDLTGDGVALTTVDLFREVHADWLANDTNPNDVAQDDVFSEVYAKDGATVTTVSTSHSKAGRVWDVSSQFGVLVEAGPAVTGPSGSGGVAGSVDDRTALAAIPAASRVDGATVLVESDGSLWRFDAAASFTSDENQQIGVTPGAGSGRWVRINLTYLKLPIAFGTADAAVLCTVPTGFVLRLTGMPYWEVTADFTGGSSSAIGISASAIATTKGDLLGGAAGNVAAALTAGTFKPGTIGPLIDTLAELQAFGLKAADFLRFDRITSAFTAGSGFVVVPCALVKTG